MSAGLTGEAGAALVDAAAAPDVADEAAGEAPGA